VQELVMSATTTPLPLPPITSEVQEFAEEQGVSAYLPAVVEMTRRIFPMAPMQVIVEGDPEIANDYHIVLEVAVPDWEADALYDAHREWVRTLIQICPSTHTCVFRLGMVSEL
jgi:hypothetical protein